MDKYEYKVRADEIKELIAQGDYIQAAEIADTIDWRRVKSVMMLCTISDLYKINRRYEDARDLLLLAYERRPGGRTICYSLCELSIKTEDFVQAVEYYKEYVQVAPKDPGRYILQYKLYEAQDVSLEERIEVLEELKKRDYREKWAYELAYLYHRIGLATRCVEECDELILWFGEGKYVIKAMELKMLHQPLTPTQQEKYDRRFEPVVTEEEYAEAEVSEPVQEAASEQNAQDTFGNTKIFGDSMMTGEMEYGDAVVSDEASVFDNTQLLNNIVAFNNTREFEVVNPENATEAEDDLDIHVKTMDVNNQYNTINLQEELAAGLREILGEEKPAVTENPITQAIIAPMFESDTESLDYPEIDEVDEDDLEPESFLEEMEGSEVFFGETEELGGIVLEDGMPVDGFSGNDVWEDVAPYAEDVYGEPYAEDVYGESYAEEAYAEESSTAERVMDEFRRESHREAEQRVIMAQPPKEMAGVLAQESDGQLSLVVPENQNVEKQITGQMNIEDILAEWERMKRENAEKNEKEVRQHVLEQTGDLFAEFDAAARDGLLEKLEKGDVAGIEGLLIVEEEEVEEVEEVEETTDGFEALEEAEDFESLEDNSEVEELEEIEEAESDYGWEDLSAQSETVAEEETFTEEAFEELEDEPEVMESEESEPEIAEVEEGESEEDEIVEKEATEEAEFEMTEEEATEEAEFEMTEEEITEEAEFEESEVQETESEDIENQEVEIQEPEVQEPEVQEPEVQEPEVQEPEVQEPESEEDEQEDFDFQTAEIEAWALGFAEDADASEGESVGFETSPFVVEELAKTTEISGLEGAEVASEKLGAVSAYAEASETDNVEDGFTEPDEAENIEREPAKVRELTKEERVLFAPFIQSKSTKEQLANVLDNISMAAYTGNVIITGGEGVDTLTLAKNIIREVKQNDSNFSGKVAKVSGQSLNRKDMQETIKHLEGGALIILSAAEMKKSTAHNLYRALQQEQIGIIVILEDSRSAMDKLLSKNADLQNCFTSRIDVEALSNDALVEYAKKYANDKEYSISDLGILALHTRIEEMQTLNHAVTVTEVKEVVDEAIRHAKKKTIGHFFDVLLAKRFDDEDMIILREKDFY